MYLGNYFKGHSEYVIALIRMGFGVILFLPMIGPIRGMASGSTFPDVMVAVQMIIGLALFVGFFTRLVALLGIVGMIMAFFDGWQGIFNFMDEGRLIVLFFLVFLLLLSEGAKKWSLEKKVLKKEYF